MSSLSVSSSVTIEELKSICENKNVEFNTEYEGKIGFKFNNHHVWHWFKIVNYKDQTWFSFHHSYSMNTGASKKGFRHGYKIAMSIEKKLGVTL